MSISQAVFAAGCFWGIQAVFDTVPGVVSTTVGYTGGQTENPDYRQVCTGGTGHAEAVKVVFDDKMVTYDQLLDIFFCQPRPDHAQPPGTGRRHPVPVGRFLVHTGTKERGPGQNRRTEQLGNISRAGGNRSGAGCRILSGRRIPSQLPGQTGKRRLQQKNAAAELKRRRMEKTTVAGTI